MNKKMIALIESFYLIEIESLLKNLQAETRGLSKKLTEFEKTNPEFANRIRKTIEENKNKMNKLYFSNKNHKPKTTHKSNNINTIKLNYNNQNDNIIKHKPIRKKSWLTSPI